MNGIAADPPERVTLVLGTSAGGTGAYVRMLAAGLADRRISVSVTGPSAADARFSFSAVPGVSFTPVEIGDRPRAGDLAAIVRLRRLLLRTRGNGPRGTSPGSGYVAHAHGLRAGALTVLALLLVRGRRRPGVVVTVHNAPPAGAGTGLVYRLLERIAARGADLVLCVSPDLEQRIRAAGARHVRMAVIAAPAASPGPAAGLAPAPPGPASLASDGPPSAVPAADGSAFGGPASGEETAGAWPIIPSAGRPIVLAVGRLAAQKGFGVLVEAAVAWRDLDPAPLVVIAGDGPLAGELRARAGELGVDVLFLEHRGDVPALLAAADVFVLPSRWEGQPLVLQEALRAGTPIVATRVGGIPGLTGQDTALLIPPEDAGALAAAVRAVLTDPPLAAALRVAAVTRAAALPSEADAVSAALDAYASLRRSTGLR
jgi:glycosyltransferase involved in cell wall biosynthesis